MKNEEGILVKTRELKRLKVIEQVIEKRMKQGPAGALLRLSVRQIRRLVGCVKKDGIKGLIHKLRGKTSNRRHEESRREKILNLCRKKYEGFGPTLAQEKLEELDKLHVNRETLRQWMLAEGLWELQRKGRKHREWRERKACIGEMIQIDGSHHDWLEGRGPKLVLMGYIDDATSDVFAWFYDYEGTMPAMDSFYRYTKRNGLPHSIYLDRLKAYKGGTGGQLSVEEALEGKRRSLSQFERALEELGVDVIHAQSAQAKGRIERLFRTFQDRVVKEMRLAGVRTKEEANRFLETYLPKYNRRFSVKAREQANLHRPSLRDQELRYILSIQEKRGVRNDNTIRHEAKLYQLKIDKPLKEVMVQERIDGKLYVVHGNKDIVYRELREPPKRKDVLTIKKAIPKQKPIIPVMSHPWKGPSFRLVQALKGQKPENFLRLNVLRATIPAADGAEEGRFSGLSANPQNSQRERKKEAKKERESLLLSLT